MQTRVEVERGGAAGGEAQGPSRQESSGAQSGVRRGPASRIAGIGSALPANTVTNHDLSKIVDTSDDWIVARTGIRERRIAAEGEFTSHLAERAARAALQNAGRTIDAVDLIIVATATPDHTFPATAVVVQQRLGMAHGAAFDVGAACSGFLFGLSTADAMIASGAASNVLLIGAETFSRILDWEDRTTCVLFGDGAGAVLLESSGDADGAQGPRGIVAHALRSDGAHRDKLFVDGGPSTSDQCGHVRMRGQEVFRFAVQATVDVVEDVMAKSGITASDVDWFVPHQANQRIISASAKKLGIAADKVVLTVAEHGNTSAASIPLALDVAVRDGRIKRGDLVLLEALGGGFTWAAAVVRW